MTVCIAAISDRGAAVVVASDRMVSGGDVEFEQDTVKIDVLSPQSLALTAGSAVEHVDLLRACSQLIQQRVSPRIYDIAELVKESFLELRKKRAEEQYFKPLGFDLEWFLTHQNQLSQDVVLRLTRTLEVAELELEMIVAGVDNTGGHVYYIADPGTASCMDALGFSCIGSGEHHATMTFVRGGYSTQTPLWKALYLAYEAKRDAEVAPGVGDRFTDLAYATTAGKVFATGQMIAHYKKNVQPKPVQYSKGTRLT